MKNVRLIVTDMDGSFVIDKERICPENIEAVAAAREAGILVCACTARLWPMARGQVREAGFNELTVVSNGGAIVDNRDGTVIERSLIPEEDVERMIRMGMAHEANVGLYTHGLLPYLPADMQGPSPYDNYRKRWSTWRRELCTPAARCENVDQMMIMGGFETELVEMMSDKPLHWTEEEQAYLSRFSTTGVSDRVIFFLNPGVDKADGVRRLAARYGIPREQVMTIGDNANDVAMLEWAGFSAVVGNATREAKAAADIVVADNDKGGAAEAIYRVLEAKK